MIRFGSVDPTDAHQRSDQPTPLLPRPRAAGEDEFAAHTSAA